MRTVPFVPVASGDLVPEPVEDLLGLGETDILLVLEKVRVSLRRVMLANEVRVVVAFAVLVLVNVGAMSKGNENPGNKISKHLLVDRPLEGGKLLGPKKWGRSRCHPERIRSSPETTIRSGSAGGGLLASVE